MEAIIALIVLFFAGKYILFHVRTNSVIFLLFSIVAASLRPPLIPIQTPILSLSRLSIVLLAINVIDCIRDIAIADKFYDDLSDGIDKQFAIKSLSTIALLLLGIFVWDGELIYTFIPRAFFLCIIHPFIALKVRSDVQGKIEIGYPLPYNKWLYSRSTKECYFYHKLVTRLYNDGKLVVNVDTVNEEFAVSGKKLSDSYPKTIVSRIAKAIQHDKELKQKTKQVEEKLSQRVKNRHCAYISSAFFEQYESKIARVLASKQAVFSPWKIKELVELQDLHLTAPNGYVKDVEWSEYFIIKALKKMVRNGTIQDFQCSDEPLNNHAYGVKMPSRDASNDPRLALDDD